MLGQTIGQGEKKDGCFRFPRKREGGGEGHRKNITIWGGVKKGGVEKGKPPP